MEKIFDESVVEYLKSTGVSENEIQKIKFDSLKKYSIDTLVEIISLIKKNKFEEIDKHTTVSPAGDGHGCYDHFINFGEVTGDYSININELIKTLKKYNNG